MLCPLQVEQTSYNVTIIVLMYSIYSVSISIFFLSIKCPYVLTVIMWNSVQYCSAVILT